VNTALHIFPIPGIPEIQPKDDVADIIIRSAENGGIRFQNGDIFVIAQKIVSKAEGRVYTGDDIEVSDFAKQMSAYTGHTPEYMELVLENSRRIVRMAGGLVIAQTRHGFVMANAGIDSSNTGGSGKMVALPADPDASAAELKRRIEAASGISAAVLISDTFGRPWRNGHVNMAIGAAGLLPLIDYRGQKDNDGREMQATQIAVADELCSAAELVSGKTNRLPVVVIRNFHYSGGAGTAQDLIRDEDHDLFK
jgi:coenzyme F420-0:L-glutamate ligase / coenzyme F420-1:gamma-L-glutamate ligase